MGRFETIVRPVIFPNIRPVQTRSVAPESDPEEGLAHINGAGGRIISTTYNFTHNISRQKHKEIKRRVDVVRVYQKEEDGTVNKENFIDVDVVTALWLKTSGEAGAWTDSAGVSTPRGGSGDLERPTYFARVKESDNIEIREKDIIRKNEV